MTPSPPFTHVPPFWQARLRQSCGSSKTQQLPSASTAQTGSQVSGPRLHIIYSWYHVLTDLPLLQRSNFLHLPGFVFKLSSWISSARLILFVVSSIFSNLIGGSGSAKGKTFPLEDVYIPQPGHHYDIMDTSWRNNWIEKSRIISEITGRRGSFLILGDIQWNTFNPFLKHI